VANDTKYEFAVVIPCYNAAPYLGRALDSVFAQTYRSFYTFVIDDGSTDDPAAVLRPYGDRIFSIRRPHAGQASARNQGIRLSNSPYVAFLDADDEWLPTKLERQIEVLHRDPRIGLVYSDCFNNADDNTKGSHFARVGTPGSGRVFEHFLNRCGVFTPTAVVRRECFNHVGLFNEALPVGEDYNLWLRIAAGWDVAVIPEVLAIRHVTPGSLSQTTSLDRALSTVITAFEDVMQACPELKPDQRRALRRAIAKRYYGYGSHLLEKGERRLSREQILQAMRYGLQDWRPIAKLALGFLPYRAYARLPKIKDPVDNGSKR